MVHRPAARALLNCLARTGGQKKIPPTRAAFVHGILLPYTDERKKVLFSIYNLETHLESGKIVLRPCKSCFTVGTIREY